MFIYKNILVPTDFSKGSQNALKHAIEIAKSMDSTIHLLHVMQPVIYPVGIEIAGDTLIDLQNEIERNANKNMDKIIKELDSHNIKNQKHTLLGKASQQIVDFCVDDVAIDLIVIATHGASGLEHFIFGSTTEQVIRHVKCPVLVVHFPKTK